MKRRSFLTGLLGAAGLAALPKVVLPTEDEVRRFYSIPSGKVFGEAPSGLVLTESERKLLSSFRAEFGHNKWGVWATDVNDAARLQCGIVQAPVGWRTGQNAMAAAPEPPQLNWYLGQHYEMSRYLNVTFLVDGTTTPIQVVSA